MARSLFKFALLLLAILAGPVSASAQSYAIMEYVTARRDLDGEQPFTYSYQIEVTAYFDLATPLVLPLQVVSLSRPAGITEATALSYVSLNVSSLTFGADSQKRPVMIFINVPAGQKAGDYGYAIKVNPSAWPSGIQVFDEGSFINMEIRDKASAALPPSIAITSPGDLATFTYRPAVGPLLIPYTFTAAATDTSPILSVDADLNNSSVAVTAAGINTTAVTGSGTLSITAGGLYTLRTRASNATATATDSVDFTVVVDAPAPTITPAKPSNGAVYTYTVGGSAVQVPVDFTATSAFGAISAISATLNGTPISSLTATGLNTLQATGSATLSISTPGTYSLIYSGTNAQGTASTTLSFTVSSVAPTPVVTISQPTAGTTITRVAGSAATVVPFAFQATTPGGTIQAVSVTLNGNPITATAGGLNTATATGSGNFSVTTPGTYTMVATGSNGSAVASATRTFTVTETTAPVTTNLIWLPPITDGTTITGGEVMPVRFSLSKNGALVRDQNVVIAIYEVFANGTSGNPTFYSYGAYSITSNVYNLNYTTAAGAHRYKVEVYASSTSSAQLLGTKEINTKAATKPNDDCDHHRDCDRDHRSNRSCNRNNSHDDDCDRNHDRHRNCNHNKDNNHSRDCDRDHSRYRSCNNNDRQSSHDRDCDRGHEHSRNCNHNKDNDHDHDCDRDHDRNRSCNRNDRDNSSNSSQSWLGNLISSWFGR